MRPHKVILNHEAIQHVLRALAAPEPTHYLDALLQGVVKPLDNVVRQLAVTRPQTGLGPYCVSGGCCIAGADGNYLPYIAHLLSAEGAHL